MWASFRRPNRTSTQSDRQERQTEQGSLVTSRQRAYEGGHMLVMGRPVRLGQMQQPAADQPEELDTVEQAVV